MRIISEAEFRRELRSDEYRNAVLEEAACALWRLAQQYDAEVGPVGGSLQAQHYRFAANTIRALKRGLVAGADGCGSEQRKPVPYDHSVEDFDGWYQY